MSKHDIYCNCFPHENQCSGCACQSGACPCRCAGPTGPTGPIGATGAAGASILGTYETYAALIAAHPTGTGGDAYLVGGMLYVWNTTTGRWENMGRLIGPTGATGATGAAGASILGTYETYAALIAAHPTGTGGDAYLVGGMLYVWNTTTGRWENMGSLIGPTGATGAAGAAGTAGVTGATGPLGADGADGTIGKIEGIVATAADLPMSGMEQGTLFYVEENSGVYLWDEALEAWILLDVAQGPRGATGPTGPTGPQGADGTLGTIRGIAATVAGLPASGAAQGDLFYVEEDGGLYVWDAASGWTKLSMVQGPRGATGATGPQGSTGSAGPEGFSIIPFCSQQAPISYVSNGVPTKVTLLGFGYSDGRLNTSDLDDFAIPISNSDGSVDLGSYPNNQMAFSLPFDTVIRSIALTVGNWEQFNPDGIVYPYIQVYAAAAESNTFMPIAEAVAAPANGLGPGTVQSNTMRAGLVQNLDVKLRAGTRILIGALVKTEQDTDTTAFWLYFTGGIGMTRWVE